MGGQLTTNFTSAINASRHTDMYRRKWVENSQGIFRMRFPWLGECSGSASFNLEGRCTRRSSGSPHSGECSVPSSSSGTTTRSRFIPPLLSGDLVSTLRNHAEWQTNRCHRKL